MLAYYETNQNPYRIFKSSNLDFPLHMHRELELLYLETGQMHLVTKDAIHSLREGDCAFFFPNRIHGYRTEEKSEGILLIVNPELVPGYQEEFREMDCEDPVVRKEAMHPDVPYCLNRLYEERHPACRQEITGGFLSVISGRLLDALTLRPGGYQEPADLTHKMLLYINDNYREPLTLKKLAETLGASPYYLSRIFSRTIGCGFNEYINTLRIDYVKRQLRRSDAAISQIAFESGFETLHTFNRVFLSMCGMTPSRYRKICRSGGQEGGV